MKRVIITANIITNEHWFSLYFSRIYKPMKKNLNVIEPYLFVAWFDALPTKEAIVDIVETVEGSRIWC